MEKVVKSKCLYQVVFCVKFKKDLLIEDVKIELEKIISDMQGSLEITVVDLAIFPYYVQMIVEADETVAVGKLVYQIKRTSAGLLKKSFPHLKSRVPNLWTGESLIRTIGNNSDLEIDLFLKQQKTRKDEKNEL